MKGEAWPVRVFPFFRKHYLKVMKCKIIMMLGLLVATAACTGGKDGGSETMRDTVPDSTMYVVLDNLTPDSLFVTLVETSGHRTFSHKAAAAGGKVHGSLTVGDTLALVPDFKQRSALSVVNVSELTGLWFYENASGSGLLLGRDGAACAVGETDGATLTTWKVKNGAFILYYVRSDGSDYTERADTSAIRRLDNGHLVFTLRGKAYNCVKATRLHTSD